MNKYLSMSLLIGMFILVKTSKSQNFQFGISVLYEYDDAGNRIVRRPYTENDVESGHEERLTNFYVFPNPTSTSTALYFNEIIGYALTIKLLNSYGQILFTELVAPQNEFVEIPTNEFPSGIYLLQLIKDEEVIESLTIIKAE